MPFLWAARASSTRTRRQATTSPTKAVPRSYDSVTMVTRQPSFSAPTRLPTGIRTSSRKSWANSSDPASVRSGRTVMPGASMGIASQVMPRCLGASGSVRTSSSHQSATSACEVQILAPLTTYASPSRTARVRSAARSEPASGSLNP